MKIFIGWPYDALWVGDYVVPLIRSYGVDVLTGAELQGQTINQGVRDNIAQADRVIVVTTRRSQDGDVWRTSQWVIEEMNHASSIGKQYIWELRENGIAYESRLHDQRQYTLFADVPSAMLEVAQVVSAWRGLTYKLKLSPEEFIGDMRQRVSRRDRYACSYSVRRQGRVEIDSRPAVIVKEEQGLVIWLHDLPIALDSYLDLVVEAGGDRWTCDGIQLGSHEITMEKQP